MIWPFKKKQESKWAKDLVEFMLQEPPPKVDEYFVEKAGIKVWIANRDYALHVKTPQGELSKDKISEVDRKYLYNNLGRDLASSQALQFVMNTTTKQDA